MSFLCASRGAQGLISQGRTAIGAKKLAEGERLPGAKSVIPCGCFKAACIAQFGSVEARRRKHWAKEVEKAIV
jgi:hypothetical protein